MDEDALGWLVLLGPPAVGGVFGGWAALAREQPMSALNRGVYVTWGIGIVLGFVAGGVAERLQPGSFPGMSIFFGVIVQVPVSFVMGLVIGSLCAIWIRIFGPLRQVRSKS